MICQVTNGIDSSFSVALGLFYSLHFSSPSHYFMQNKILEITISHTARKTKETKKISQRQKDIERERIVFSLMESHRA